MLEKKANKAAKAGKERARRPRREKAVGGPSVGRMRGGMLKLSKRDVAEIQGRRQARR